MTLEKFLQENNISKSDWEESGCEWTVLQAIALDYRSHQDELKDVAEFYAKIVQKISQVHSVRWRVKDEQHLLEKIVRKRIEKNEKYYAVDKDNYFEIVTDLVGIRALHLFKEECIDIHHSILSIWNPAEKLAFIRDGDTATDTLESLGLAIKVHPAGYRSLHYVFTAKPIKRLVNIELQVRTIFEEGWSEIDHKIRYPNFSDNQLVAYFLTIFNRLAGSADEMGSFVKGLSSELSGMNQALADAAKEKQEILAKMDSTLAELETEKDQSKNSSIIIEKLKDELKSLKSSSSANPGSSVLVDFLNALAKASKELPSSKNLEASLGIPRSANGNTRQLATAKKLPPDSIPRRNK